MKITIIGTGYVGLITGVCLAQKGHSVTCVDTRKEVVEKLNTKIPHIYERDLQEALKEVVDAGNFRATVSLGEGLNSSSLVIVAVGTPSENGEIDLSQIEQAVTQIADYIKDTNRYLSVVIKSTVVPGTTDTFVKEILERVSGKKLGEFGLGMNPEFLREGEAISDFINPDRIVIGYEDVKTRNLLDELYAPWDCDKIYINTRTAEMIKYANNTILAALISLNNELANHSTILGNIDYMHVIDGISLDKRWSPVLNGKRIKPGILEYFVPGSGFGGSCFPKDVQAIRTQGVTKGQSMHILNAVLEVNDRQPETVMSLLEEKVGVFASKKVAVLGLAFKPGTDDVRESTAIKIIQYLLKKNAEIFVHDPIAIENSKKVFDEQSINWIDNWRSVLLDIDIIIIATNWQEYNHLIELDSNNDLKGKIIFDSKRLFKSAVSFKNNTLITTGKS